MYSKPNYYLAYENVSVITNKEVYMYEYEVRLGIDSKIQHTQLPGPHFLPTKIYDIIDTESLSQISLKVSVQWINVNFSVAILFGANSYKLRKCATWLDLNTVPEFYRFSYPYITEYFHNEIKVL
jgi:hypothetical protein